MNAAALRMIGMIFLAIAFIANGEHFLVAQANDLGNVGTITGAITALAITGGLICQIVLQLMARTAAAERDRKAEKAEEGRKAEAAAQAAKAEQNAKVVQAGVTNAQKAAQSAAAKVNDVAVALEDSHAAAEEARAATNEKLDRGLDLAKSTHILVNSSMSAQLKISMIALRRLADETKDPGDMAAASLAEKLFHEHEAKQAKVDAIAKDSPSP